MSSSSGGVLAFGGKSPDIHASVFLADGCRIIGDVVIGRDSSVWFNAVVRGDIHWVRIGTSVNIQDNAVLHVTHEKAPLTIGNGVTIGHAAVVHGCTLKDNSLVGMGAVVLDGAVVGPHALIAAGSVVREGMQIPEGALAAGNPARVKRELSQAERAELEQVSQRYVSYALTYLRTYRER